MRLLSNCLTATSCCALAAVATSVSAQVRAPASYEAVSSNPATATDAVNRAQDIAIGVDPYDRMTVKVSIQGRGPYNFLVDTGADHTVVSSALAGSLNLVPGERVQMYTITGDQSVKTAALGQMKFSEKTMQNVTAAVLDAAHLGADGVIGIDSLRSERVTFDFAKGLMTIVPSRSAEPRADGDTIVVTGRLKAGRLVLTEANAGGKSVNVVVDTGSDITVGNRALRRKLHRSGLLHSVGPIALKSVTGHIIAGDLMVLDKLNVGGVVIEQMSIVFTDAPIFKVLKLEDRPAVLLGMNAIRAFKRVSIDFANRKFRVVVPQKSAIEGLQLASR